MKEIESLLKKSIHIIKNCALEDDVKRHVCWSLERLPTTYGLPEVVIDQSELDDQFDYREIDPFELGLFISDEAKHTSNEAVVYDWCAFLLNYSGHYFADIDNTQKLEALQEIKKILFQIDFSNYKPTHPSLTIYPNGHESFSEIQNNLIKWFLMKDMQ